MKNFVLDHVLEIMSVLGACVAVYTVVFWGSMPTLQRCTGIFILGITLHLWEEGRFPGGFTAMITERLHFTQLDPRFGDFVTALLVLLIGYVPFFFPNIAFLVFAGIFLGYVEVFAHLVAIKMFKKDKPYTPGMATALVVLLPIAVYTTWYLVANALMAPLSWLFSIACLLVCVAVAQQVVVRTSGMKYSVFLKNVQGALRGK